MPRKNRRSQARRKPAKPTIPSFGGDHGTGTAAAMNGTVVEAMTDEQGHNPNNMGRRRRVSAIERIDLTLRQTQAANAITDAWCMVESLSSGGPTMERVDSNPKPDAAIAAQVGAVSRWIRVTRAIPRADREIVFLICVENQAITMLGRRYGISRALPRFRDALDKVADKLGY